MRPTGSAAALSLAVAATVLTVQLSGSSATADDPAVPSPADIREAREAARGAVSDVESVQADLAAANQRLKSSRIAAALAAEAYNGARWRAQQARRAARQAREQAAVAAADLQAQADVYSDTVVNAYETMPELSGLSAVLDSDDLGTMHDRSATLENASQAMDQREDEFRDASDAADRARDEAMTAEADAVAAKDTAVAARDQARSAADAAAAEAQAVAAEKSRLIGELARLEGVSVELAQRRQTALDQRAQEEAAAAAAAQHAAAEAAAAAAQQAEEQAVEEQAEQADEPAGEPADDPAQPEQPEQPTTTDSTPPAPGGGAQAAIAFARDQIGEPYVWGAEGPGSWDCSGLTMAAWATGGKSLPHYSVAQYQQSTPISAGDLRPGDLVFWGSSRSSSSIYHVALYVGDGMIIHAPRSGRDVEEVSMYYWVTPSFYARP